MANELNGVTYTALNAYGEVIIIDPLKQLGITASVGQSIGCLFAVAGGFYILGYIFLRTFSSKLSSWCLYLKYFKYLNNINLL